MCLGSIYSLMHWYICCCSTTFLVMVSFLYLRFYFEITTVLNNYRFTYKRIERDPCTLCHISPKGNILKSCTTISQSGYWHWYSQDSEYFHHHRIPHFAFLGHTHFHSAHLSPGNHSSVLHFYNCVTPGMIYTWNHAVYNLGIVFSLSVILCRFIQVQPWKLLESFCSEYPHLQCPLQDLLLNVIKLLPNNVLRKFIE